MIHWLHTAQNVVQFMVLTPGGVGLFCSQTCRRVGWCPKPVPEPPPPPPGASGTQHSHVGLGSVKHGQAPSPPPRDNWPCQLQTNRPPNLVVGIGEPSLTRGHCCMYFTQGLFQSHHNGLLVLDGHPRKPVPLGQSWRFKWSDSGT